MSTIKKKEKVIGQVGTKVDPLFELADLAAASLIEGSEQIIDPFEQYTSQLKTKFCSNSERFRHRFAKGYQVLLDEIAKNV